MSDGRDLIGKANQESEVSTADPKYRWIQNQKRDPKESLFCGANGNRTSDTRIFSPLLYQLSYGTSRELRLNTIRDYVAHKNFRRALALRSANASLVYVPMGPCGVLVLRKAGAKVLLFFELTKFFCIFFANMRIFL